MIKQLATVLLIALCAACNSSPASSHLANIVNGGSPVGLGRSFVLSMTLEADFQSFLTDNGMTTEPCFQWVQYEDDTYGIEQSASACPPGSSLVDKAAVVSRIGVTSDGEGYLYSNAADTVGVASKGTTSSTSTTSVGTLASDGTNLSIIASLCTGEYDNSCSLLLQGGALTGISYPPPAPTPAPSPGH